MDDEAVPVMMVATCRTPGCPVENISYDVAMYPNVSPPTFRAQCAQCHQRVTDLVPAQV